MTRVLESGWLAAGEVTERFERAFAERSGVRHAVAVTNGTAALHLAHLLAGVGRGDEVLCPALTFVASANAARYAGAEVVFADAIGPGDLTLSPADVERKITPRTRAIVVVHYAGFTCRMEEIGEIAERHGIAVIEDCAHAPLARHGDRAVGSLGRVGAFSFFANKNLTTGEGGMLTTDDDEIAARARRLRSHGMTSSSHDRFRGRASTYEVAEMGYNYRIDDLRSAIGLVQLEKLEERNARRRELFAAYVERLRPAEGLRVPFADRDLRLAAPHILPVVSDRDPEPLRERLHRAGIQTSKHYDLVNGFPIYGGDTASTPVAAGLNLFTLPFDARMSYEEVREVSELMLASPR